jgi:predicted RNase H-like HicB family nuclease
MQAKVALHQDKDGIWIAECLNMPGCVSEGETREEAVQMLQDAMRGWLAVMREDYPELSEQVLNVEVQDVEVAV